MNYTGILPPGIVDARSPPTHHDHDQNPTNASSASTAPSVSRSSGDIGAGAHRIPPRRRLGSGDGNDGNGFLYGSSRRRFAYGRPKPFTIRHGRPHAFGGGGDVPAEPFGRIVESSKLRDARSNAFDRVPSLVKTHRRQTTLALDPSAFCLGDAFAVPLENLEASRDERAESPNPEEGISPALGVPLDGEESARRAWMRTAARRSISSRGVAGRGGLSGGVGGGHLACTRCVRQRREKRIRRERRRGSPRPGVRPRRPRRTRRPRPRVRFRSAARAMAAAADISDASSPDAASSPGCVERVSRAPRAPFVAIAPRDDDALKKALKSKTRGKLSSPPPNASDSSEWSAYTTSGSYFVPGTRRARLARCLRARLSAGARPPPGQSPGLGGTGRGRIPSLRRLRRRSRARFSRRTARTWASLCRLSAASRRARSSRARASALACRWRRIVSAAKRHAFQHTTTESVRDGGGRASRGATP